MIAIRGPYYILFRGDKCARADITGISAGGRV